MAEWPAAHYHKVIAAIHEHRETPFSIAEIRKASGASQSTCIRVMKQLVKIDMLIHTPLKVQRAYAGRQYRVAQTWPVDDVKEVVNNFIFSKLLKV